MQNVQHPVDKRSAGCFLMEMPIFKIKMMKLPENSDQVTIIPGVGEGVYPAQGFLMFEEAALGNGDYYGLYWEVGKEEQEPIVCETMHEEEGIIEPRFSSLDKFLKWYEINDYDWGEIEIEDDDFVWNCLEVGDRYVQQNKPEEAIVYYKKATNSVSEMSTPWYKLAAQQLRMKQDLEAQQSLMNAILSNWTLGFPSENAIRLFRQMQFENEFKIHPLIKHKEGLTFKFGRKNEDYVILREIIQELKEAQNIRDWFLMEQNYAYRMARETSSFRRKNNFNLAQWQGTFSQFAEQTLNRTVEE